MGDVRFEPVYQGLTRSADRAREIRELEDEDVIGALAAASNSHDALLANVLATEALNRVRRLRASLAHMNEGVAALSTKGAVTWVNAAAERLLSRTRQELIGRDLHEVISHRDAEGRPIPRESCPLLLEPLAGRTTFFDGDQFVRPDGSIMCVTVSSAPILASGGEPEGIVIAFADCTERKAAERALRESEQRYRSLFENSPDAIAVLGIDGTILDTNRAAQGLTGLPTMNTKGRSFEDFVHPEDVDRLRRLFAQVTAGEPRSTLVRVRASDGTTILVQAQAIPIIVDGVVVGVHALARRA